MVVRREEMKLSSIIRKSLSLVFLVLCTAIIAYGQEKEYYIERHAVSLQFAGVFRGAQTSYHYTINPRAKIMWSPNLGVGVGFSDDYDIAPLAYYNVGVNMAYGRKNRLVVGLNRYYNTLFRGSRTISLDVGYINFGKNHFFFSATARFNYYTVSDVSQYFPFNIDIPISLGWNF